MAQSITLKRRSLQFVQHAQNTHAEYMIPLQDTCKTLCFFILYYKYIVFYILPLENNPVHLLWHHVLLGDCNLLFLTVHMSIIKVEGG